MKFDAIKFWYKHRRLLKKVHTESDAYLFLERLRWGKNEPVCPHCQNVGAYFIKPSEGDTRKTNRGTPTQRRLWTCKACRKQFSVITKTVLHGTHIPIKTWLLVLFEMTSNKNGIGPWEIVRKYNLTIKSARYMTHRIREAMKREPLFGMLNPRID